MARQKVEDSLLYWIFHRVSVWASVAIVAASYVVLRYLLPLLMHGNPWAVIGAAYAPWITFVMAVIALYAEADKHKRRKLLEKQTGLGTLREMSWQDFELLVGEAYRRQGYRVEETGGGGPDGGVDLILGRDRETALVQCKRWKQAKVRAPTMRELRGAVARDAATRGIFVTCGEFTAEAIAEAQGQPPIELVNGAALLELVRQAHGQTPTAQETPTPVPEAPAAPPACPNCGKLMVKRTARSGANAGNKLWGCSTYPRCRGTRQI